MLWYILAIIGTGLLIYGTILYTPFFDDVYFGWTHIFMYGGGLLLAIAIGCAVGFDYTDLIDYTFSEEPVLRETTEICSLDDKYSVKGYLFLGSGTVSSEDYYYFIKETDKGKITDKIPQKETYITEDNSQKPRIEEYAYKGERNATLDFWFSWDFGVNKEDFSYKTAYYRVFIPENTIRTDFSVDLN